MAAPAATVPPPTSCVSASSVMVVGGGGETITTAGIGAAAVHRSLHRFLRDSRRGPAGGWATAPTRVPPLPSAALREEPSPAPSPDGVAADSAVAGVPSSVDSMAWPTGPIGDSCRLIAEDELYRTPKD
eukprot:GHVT01030567.1.p2 GENE.GHVT01030567.1~~GHVT01030567.1.p2  ORF type:complete len:129 (-),score=22.79 GHVT01030567.1:786-1172(-)